MYQFRPAISAITCPFYGSVWWKTGWNRDLQCLGGMKLGQELSRTGLSSTQMFSFYGFISVDYNGCRVFCLERTPKRKNDCRIYGILITSNDNRQMLDNSNPKKTTLQGTNISPEKSILKMIFLFPRWDMLVPWRVNLETAKSSLKKKGTNLCVCQEKIPSSISPRTQRISLSELYNFALFCSDCFSTKSKKKLPM